jgi:sulfide:quinone oxidoreductase
MKRRGPVMAEVPGAMGAHDFYTLDGAMRLRKALEGFDGGTIVIGVAGIPYKCQGRASSP